MSYRPPEIPRRMNPTGREDRKVSPDQMKSSEEQEVDDFLSVIHDVTKAPYDKNGRALFFFSEHMHMGETAARVLSRITPNEFAYALLPHQELLTHFQTQIAQLPREEQLNFREEFDEVGALFRLHTHSAHSLSTIALEFGPKIGHRDFLEKIGMILAMRKLFFFGFEGEALPQLSTPKLKDILTTISSTYRQAISAYILNK